MSLSPVRHVFVYGTLRRGQERDITRLRPAPRWIGYGCVSGVLYQLGTYPGLVLGGPGWVQGEVYEISAELERQLDEIEDVWPQRSGEYCKREIAVRLEDVPCLEGRAKQVGCLVYEITLECISGMPVIACGDWTQYRAAAEP